MPENNPDHPPRLVELGGEVIRFPTRDRGTDNLSTPDELDDFPIPDAEPLPPLDDEEPSADLVPHIEDAEIVDDQAPATTHPVDAPAVATDTGTWLEQRRAYLADAPPVIPSYLRDSDEFTQAARWVTSYYAHIAAFHTTRSPIYLLRLMGRGPRGIARAARAWWTWAADTESRPLIRNAAGREMQVNLGDGVLKHSGGDSHQYMLLSMRHDQRVKGRMVVSAVVAVPVTVLLVLGVLTMPGWAVLAWAAAVDALFGLGVRNKDKPIVSRYVAVQFQRPLDSDEVTAALAAIGVKGRIDFVNPIQVDGPGWRAEIDLPPGVLAEKLLDKRKELSGAMRRPLQCVWPSVGTEHTSRAVLWVAKKDPRTIKRVWPLLTDGQTDFYDEFPFGVTPRGEAVPVSLIGTNVLIGGVMGSGKTSAVLVIALAAALDPTCKIWIFELKGSGDMESVQPVAYRYVQGDDDEHCEVALSGMRALEAEMKRRKKVVAELPIEDVPNGRKVTRKLADKYPHLRLDPLLAIFDEVHTLFEHPKYGKKAAEVAGRLIRKARAYGIILVLTTQKPDADSIPKMVSDNAILRFCLAITGHIANDLILGTGMYKRGIRANIFEPAEGDDPKDSGTGWLSRSATNAKIVRAYFIPQGDAREVGRRALALRTAAGTLSGEAAGEEVVDADTSTVVDHVRAVWPDGAAAVHSHRLIEALARFRPDTYAVWLEEEDAAARSTLLNNALKPFKVPTKQLTIRECCGGGAKGVRWDDVPEPSGDGWEDEEDGDD
ncbi:S-DNA-T family DNA segregation ATPase FtsK/SpoIIIE [Nocardiopsis sp. Huas11]|uniref:FtsK/SpoIIIE domain-containing protein n=1 Tax=Nocardiopsis sp. Huas11 TaxID=2183912 RepID=UPI000EB4D141|nr:FtsK/SpoIIIE domain-containing protein [Nocardiopsis sp. Huas11]RKS10027.1 S-DNA-T family DNA segregation ATPase FtsK/SpoIIIE [Nocardiopsis sp. Huas11]